MKLVFASILFASGAAHASMECADTAVRVARENSRGSAVVEFTPLKASRSYLEAYQIGIENTQDGDVQTFAIVLMKSDCSTVSITPVQ